MVWLLLTCQAREFGASQKANHCEMWETLRSKSSVGWGSLETFIVLDILSFPRITWEQGCKSGRETGMVKLLKKHFSDTFFLACFTVARGSVCTHRRRKRRQSRWEHRFCCWLAGWLWMWHLVVLLGWAVSLLIGQGSPMCLQSWEMGWGQQGPK